jgi:hypothetical protein
MAQFYVADANGEWVGPVDPFTLAEACRQGRYEATRAICVTNPPQGEVVTTAGAFAREFGRAPPLAFFLKVGAAAAALYAAKKGVDYLRADPETRAIQASAERHERRGAVVRADLPGWPRPPVLRGRIPDVHADYGTHQVVEEYENPASVERGHAREQDAAFRAWEARTPDRSYTQHVVPGGRGGRG